MVYNSLVFHLVWGCHCSALQQLHVCSGLKTRLVLRKSLPTTRFSCFWGVLSVNFFVYPYPLQANQQVSHLGAFLKVLKSNVIGATGVSKITLDVQLNETIKGLHLLLAWGL